MWSMTAGHEYWRALSKALSKDCEQKGSEKQLEVNNTANKVSTYSQNQKDV